jgi:hypothetical protein
VEVCLRDFCPSTVAGCGDLSGIERSGGFGLLGLRMRRSAAYLSSSPRSRHRRRGKRGRGGLYSTNFCRAHMAFLACLRGAHSRMSPGPASQHQYSRSGLVQNVVSFLPCPEHHIRVPRDSHSGEAKITRSPFPFLKLDIISRDDAPTGP